MIKLDAARGYIAPKMMTLLLFMGASLLYAQNSTWFVINQGAVNALLEDDVSGNPTATLFHVPAGTSISFSSFYVNVAVADSVAGHRYDLGIGACPPNGEQLSDCSLAEVPITVIFNLGTAGSAGAGIPITATKAQSYPVAQGASVLSGPGTYVLLGAGNGNSVKLAGASGAAIIPFEGVAGLATNGSLTNPSNTGLFHTNAAGAKVPGNAPMVMLH